MMRLIQGMLLSVGLALPLMVQADAYKCRLPSGQIQISNAPCAAGSKMESSQPVIEISPEQRAQAEKRVQRDRELAKEQDAARAAKAALQTPPPPPPVAAAPLPVAPAAAPPPPAPPTSPVAPAPTAVVVPGSTVLVIDPVSQCIARAEHRGMTPRQRELHAASCQQNAMPPSPPPPAAVPPGPPGKKDLYKVPVERPGVAVRVDKCVGKNCP